MKITRKSAIKALAATSGLATSWSFLSPLTDTTRLTAKCLTKKYTFNIVDYGAKGDGHTLNTKFIQKAIDDCSRSGGGKVIVPAGTFITGTIFLRSYVELYLNSGAVLKGSSFIKNYQQVDHTPALISAKNLQHVSITGLGIIDGNGSPKNFKKGSMPLHRPMLLFFTDCEDVTIKDIHLKRPAFWTQKYTQCNRVLVTNISVYAQVNWNNDGIDINNCKNVVLSDSRFDAGDDAICLKSEGKHICKNIAIANCVVASNCNGIKMGTASKGGFQNISISNCTIHQSKVDHFRHWQNKLNHITEKRTVISGIAIESVDGAKINQINIENITMKDVQTPIFIRLGARHQPSGSLRRVNISNITATSESAMCSSILGIPGHYIENIVLHNVVIINHSVGQLNNNLGSIPENIKKYPENRMLGTDLPAAGFYIRHVKNIKLNNISLQTASKEQRPFLVADDVHNLEVDSAGIDNQTNEENVYQMIYCLRNVHHAAITLPAFLPRYDRLAHLEGNSISDIRLFMKEKKNRSDLLSFGSEIKDRDEVEVFHYE